MAVVLHADVVTKPVAEYPATLHEQLSDSCELIHRATLRVYKQYSALAVAGEVDEVYSPDLAKGDFVEVSPAVPNKAVKAAQKSGFDVHIEPNTGSGVPTVAETSGSSCPNVEQAIMQTDQQRYERRRQMQSHLYKIGGDVLPPGTVEQEQPEATPSDGANKSGKEPGVQEGTVILVIGISIDGRVHQVKVERSLEPALDQKAVEAVQKWRFSPARKKGLPVPVQTFVEVNFRR